MNKIKTFFTTGIYLTMVAVLGAGGLFAYSFVTHGQNTFYVRYGDVDIYTTEDVQLERNTLSMFNCKYTLNTKMSYKVKIVPNTKVSGFDYIKDGNRYAFFAENDLTQAFDVVTTEDFFTINIPQDLTMQSVLNSLYPDSDISLDNNVSLVEHRFAIHVTSADGTTIIINFAINGG